MSFFSDDRSFDVMLRRIKECDVSMRVLPYLMFSFLFLTSCLEKKVTGSFRPLLKDFQCSKSDIEGFAKEFRGMWAKKWEHGYHPVFDDVRVFQYKSDRENPVISFFWDLNREIVNDCPESISVCMDYANLYEWKEIDGKSGLFYQLVGPIEKLGLEVTKVPKTDQKNSFDYHVLFSRPKHLEAVLNCMLGQFQSVKDQKTKDLVAQLSSGKDMQEVVETQEALRMFELASKKERENKDFKTVRVQDIEFKEWEKTFERIHSSLKKRAPALIQSNYQVTKLMIPTEQSQAVGFIIECQCHDEMPLYVGVAEDHSGKVKKLYHLERRGEKLIPIGRYEKIIQVSP